MRSEDVSREITRLVLGLDAFYRRTQRADGGKLDAEGLVPVHWSTESPTALVSWQDAQMRLEACLRAAALVPEPWARDWLCEYSLSLLCLLRWIRGDELSYEEVVAGTLRIDPRPPSARAITEVKARRDAALAQGGYKTFDAYLERDGVARSSVAPVMTELLAAARERTRARLPMLALPPEPIEVMGVEQVPFSAYCDYPGRKVWINTDVPHTRSGLKQLVAHEAYPGHYVHMYHRDRLVQAQATLPDAALVVTNTASSVLFEGIAECGLDFLAWRERPEDEIAWWHNRLQWLCSIEAAHALNTGRLSAAEVAAFLKKSCQADNAWIEGKIAFVTHALRAPFVYSYWWGGTVVGRWWRGVSACDADRALRYLYDHMHSPSTLMAHAQGGYRD